ncbi:MAG TPA: methyl-accepting chemotaxis protein [Gemmatimonadaceae bacterium]|nr:methyl-accepting chemotaxis protein [Gemmatimonadaceae bacterium]
MSEPKISHAARRPSGPPSGPPSGQPSSHPSSPPSARASGRARRPSGRRRDGTDALAAGPLQQLAGTCSLAAVVSLILLGWIGREELPHLVTARVGLLLLGVAFALAVLLTTAFVLLLVAPALNRPAAELAEVAEAVAGGDLTVRLADSTGAGQINRVWRAIGRMLVALRRLAGALRAASRETAGMADQIMTSAGAMASRAQETAQTSVALSRQSTTMSATIDGLAADALALTDIVADVAMGAHEGLLRNRQLGELASSSRRQLDDGARALVRLGEEVRESADAIEALAGASEEIRSFVALVRRMAKQSKLLSLNAAMEAARAGDQGDGFAVVAAEVRRLAADSTEAAARTEAAVGSILERVALSRTLSARTVSTVGQALAATRAGVSAYSEVQEAVAAAEEWTASVEAAAGHSSRLVTEMTSRLDDLARGTQSFAAAMHQVAASSEEQSASSQEIAAAASTLAAAAEHLSQLVRTFRLSDEAEAAPPVAPPLPMA